MIELFETNDVLMFDDILDQNPGKDILITDQLHNVLSLTRVGETSHEFIAPSQYTLWRIISFTSNTIYAIPNTSSMMRGVTVEQFIEYIKLKHPDCFDWFLFNPEWLR